MSIRFFSFSLAVFIALSLLTTCGGGGGGGDGGTPEATSVTISGTVSETGSFKPGTGNDVKMAAIAGATVKIITMAGVVETTVTTDSNGNYTASVTASQDYVIRAEKGNVVLKALLPATTSNQTVSVDPSSTAVVMVLAQEIDESNLGEVGTDCATAIDAINLTSTVTTITSDSSFSNIVSALEDEIETFRDYDATEASIGAATTSSTITSFVSTTSTAVTAVDTGESDTSDDSDTSGSCEAKSGASGLAVLKIDNYSSDVAMVIADSDGNGIVVYQKGVSGVPNLNGVAFTYSDCATGVWVTGDSGEPVSYAVASHEFTFRNYRATTSGDRATTSSGRTGSIASSLEGGGGGFDGATDSTTTEGDTTTTTTYTSTYAGKAIADYDTTTSTLTVSDTGTVSSMTVGLTIQHNWDEDLDISLISPSNTTVVLSMDNGSRGDHYTSTVFSDSGSTLITAGFAPFTGTFAPEGSLSSFNEENINGTWTLEITDDTPQNAGVLVSWYISITTPNISKGLFAPADSQTTANLMSGSCSVPTSDSLGDSSDTEVDIIYTDPDCNQTIYSNESLSSKPSADAEGYGGGYLGKAIWEAAVEFIGKSGGSPVYEILNTKETISIYANNITKWTSSYIDTGMTRTTNAAINMVGGDVEKNSQNLVHWLRGITPGITGGNSSSSLGQSMQFTDSEQAEFNSQTPAISFN